MFSKSILSILKIGRTGPRVPVLRQLSATECGAACLAMILSYHGREVSVSECRGNCGSGRDGVTAKTIAEAARQYGLRVKGYSLEPDFFKQLPLPAIAHWKSKHFIIVEKWSPKEVEIVDPSAGRRVLSAKEFNEGFTGVALTFEPGVNFERRRSTQGASWVKYLQSMLRQQGARAILAKILAASLLLQVFGLALPIITGLLIDKVIPYRMASAMTVLGLGMLLMVAAQTIISYLRSSLMITLRGRLDSYLMLDFFEHLLSLPFSFFQKRNSGDLLMRLGSNSFIREVLTSNTLSILFDGFFVLMYVLILLVACPSLGLLSLGFGVLQVIVVLGTRHHVTQLMQRELAARADEQGYLVEAVSSISLLKAAGVEDRALDRWSNLFFNQLNISLERSRFSVAIESALGAIRMLSPMLLLWLGTWLVLDGSMRLGFMLAVNALASSFLSPIMALVTNGQQLQLVSAHLERITDVLEAKPEQTLQEDGAAPRLRGQIEVRNLCFQYDPNAPLVLRDISLTIKSGQKVALVGQTGSGKSTLALLLLGLYRPTHGDIFYDGIPLQKFNYRALRGQMGVVLQEPFLFSGSILENINLGGSPSAPEKLIEAARLAGIHKDILKMPMGYETSISERGTTLSGGQRQRLAIARSLAHDPRILVLDEATSHLDVHTEAVVDQNLSGLSCTRVVIAHRLSTIRNADQILVLHEGNLVESGTHEELLLRGGYYAALVGSQDESDSEVMTATGENGASVNSQNLVN